MILIIKELVSNLLLQRLHLSSELIILLLEITQLLLELWITSHTYHVITFSTIQALLVV